MFDFGYLTPSTERVHKHVLHGVHVPRTNPQPVTLRLRFCGRGTPYWNAWNKAKELTDDTEANKRAAGWLARHGLDGWENVLDESGKPIPYTVQGGEELLHALIDARRAEKLVVAINVASSPDNFCEPAVEAVELGKG